MILTALGCLYCSIESIFPGFLHPRQVVSCKIFIENASTAQLSICPSLPRMKIIPRREMKGCVVFIRFFIQIFSKCKSDDLLYPNPSLPTTTMIVMAGEQEAATTSLSHPSPSPSHDQPCHGGWAAVRAQHQLIKFCLYEFILSDCMVVLCLMKNIKPIKARSTM